jgi:hypothetical protein
MRIRAAIFLSLCCSSCTFAQDKAALSAAEAACGPRAVRIQGNRRQSQHPTPRPEGGKALIYVVQKDDASTRFAADGKVTWRIAAPDLLVRLDRSGSAAPVRDQPYRHMEPCFAPRVKRKSGRDLLLGY